MPGAGEDASDYYSLRVEYIGEYREPLAELFSAYSVYFFRRLVAVLCGFGGGF